MLSCNVNPRDKLVRGAHMSVILVQGFSPLFPCSLPLFPLSLPAVLFVIPLNNDNDNKNRNKNDEVIII